MLHLMPPEILMMITDHLDIIDRVGLTMISKSTHCTIGPKHLWNLREANAFEKYHRNRQAARKKAAEETKKQTAHQTPNQTPNQVESTEPEEYQIPNTRKKWLLRLQKDMCGYVYCTHCDIIHSLDFGKEVLGKGRKCLVRMGLSYGGVKGKTHSRLRRERKGLSRETSAWRGRLRGR